MKKNSLIFLLFLGLILDTLPVGALNLTRAGVWGTGNYTGVAVKGNYAYCVSPYQGLDIIDIGNRSNPVRVGTCKISDFPRRVDVSGNYAYVSGFYGLVIVDISVPTSPVAVGHFYSGGYVNDVKAKDNYAYLAGSNQGNGGLTVVDVSSPSSPFQVGQYTLTPTYSYGEALFIRGNFVYLLEDFGMHIIDITDPANPALMGTGGISIYASDVYVQGNYAYASSYLSEIGYTEAYMDIIDISNPSSPVNVGTYATGGGIPGGIYTVGDYAYLAMAKDGIHIIDISVPSAPALVKKYETPGRPAALAADGFYVFVADNYGGLQILDASSPAAPSTAGAFDHSVNISDVTVKGDYAYAAGNEEGILIFNVSVPSSPVQVATVDVGGNVDRIVVEGNHAYVVPKHSFRENIPYESLAVVDISNPLSPSLAGTYQSDLTEIYGVHVNGNYAYVLGDTHTIVFLDISNPSQITVSATYDSLNTPTGIWVDGNYAYLADTHGSVDVIDVSDPANPLPVAGIGSYEYIGGITGRGNYVYITGSTFDVVDISVPSAPSGVGHYDYWDFGSVSRLHVQGDYVYLANASGLQVLDISNPASPTFAADYDAVQCEGVYADGNYVYLAGADFGKLLVLSRQETAAPPKIRVNTERLNFTADTSGAVSPAQTVTIGNGGEGTLDWDAEKTENWISCTPVSGTGSGVIEVSVDAGGLAPGSYFGAVMIVSPNANNSPLAVHVNLTVTGSGQTASPFGEFETPTQGAVVYSSVPFTGWALDDVGVESVQLFREDQGALIYIGDAVFVEGARPDVALLYPEYPNSYKAGWGYMMLTNFLPGGGNGTFVIHAVAVDVEGNRVTLGTRTIICDNANAEKPFGAIDTPAQGGTASGTGYRNNGWVLTPMPNAVPTDGSTINVYVDGVKLGNPVYNIYRSDVAELFPGYANSDGAHAFFDMDTTAFQNGVHTIAWTAEDDAGNSDGIGSRYFVIQNSQGGRMRDEGRGTRDEGRKRFLRFEMMPIEQENPGPCKEGPHAVGQENPRAVQEGCTRRVPVQGGSTRRVVEIKELERVELWLDGDIVEAYQVVGGELRPLPWGTFLDREKGIFYWQPGQGYVGRYSLAFFGTDGSGELTRWDVEVVIHPRF